MDILSNGKGLVAVRKFLLGKHDLINCTSSIFAVEVFSSITHQKEKSCMRKRIVSILILPMLILAILAMSPLSTLAAPQHNTPHFFKKGSQGNVQLSAKAN